MPIWLGVSQWCPAMTEYTVKEIDHQWIVYADRLSIPTYANEASALKLIAENSTANGATREAAVRDTRLAEIGSALVDQMAELLKLRESVRRLEKVVHK
jgi:hypothetical protein